MDPSEATQTTNGSTAEPDNLEEEDVLIVEPPLANSDVTEVAYDEITQKKLALESICFVLGLNYNSKLAEFGSQIDTKRLDQAISFLTVTRDGNYKQLKEIRKEIIAEWKLANTPFARMNAFSWILYIQPVRLAYQPPASSNFLSEQISTSHQPASGIFLSEQINTSHQPTEQGHIKDSICAEELKMKSLLSTSWVNKAKRELAALKKARDDKVKKKYDTTHDKLKNILENAHIDKKDVGFDPDKKVDKELYKSERKKLKQIIKDVKPAAAKRRELVLRVELVRDAVKKTSPLPLEDIKVLIDNAMDLARVLEEDDAVQYDGKDIDVVLGEFEQDAIRDAAKREAEKKKKEKEALPNRTRKGTRYRKRAEDLDLEEDDDETSNGGNADGPHPQ